MKKLISIGISIIVLAVSFFPGPGSAGSGRGGVLVVSLRAGVSQSLLESYGNEVEHLFAREYRLQVVDESEALAKLRSEPWVEFAEGDQVLQAAVNTNDYFYVLDQRELKKQWYLPKMETHLAWEKTTGSAQTVIAIVDTGIDAKHEDLNDGRVTKGYVSYCQAANTLRASDCLVRVSGEVAAGENSDDNGHGTIVAGLIGAISNNGKGIAGINWNVKLMPIKALDSHGSGLASDVAAGMHWATDNGARIINLSIGGPGLEGSQVLEEAVRYAFNKGVLVVAAAGNDAATSGSNLNTSPVLPVCVDTAENMIIGVAAVDVNDRKAGFSNYGSNCVDISAPGAGTFVDRDNKQGLVSTYFDPTRPGENDLYVYALGTSVAAPLVSGVAGLMISAFPDLDVKAIRDRLLASTDNIDDANGTGCGNISCVGQIGRGRINARKAVTGSIAFSSGSLVKAADGSTYLIERGLKRPVSSFVYSQRSAGWVLTAAAGGQLDNFPLGKPIAPIDGSLIKGPGLTTVYLVEDGLLHPLSYLVFVSRGYRFADVVTLSAEEVVSYEIGDLSPPQNGFLVKAVNNPAIFVIKDGKKQLVSYAVFIASGFNNRAIGIVAQDQLDPYPQASTLYPPPDGTLLLGDASGTVYVAMSGKLRGLNYNAFVNRGYSFANIHRVAQLEMSYYEYGSDIIE